MVFETVLRFIYPARCYCSISDAQNRTCGKSYPSNLSQAPTVVQRVFRFEAWRWHVLSRFGCPQTLWVFLCKGSESDVEAVLVAYEVNEQCRKVRGEELWMSRETSIIVSSLPLCGQAHLPSPQLAIQLAGRMAQLSGTSLQRQHIQLLQHIRDWFLLR